MPHKGIVGSPDHAAGPFAQTLCRVEGAVLLGLLFRYHGLRLGHIHVLNEQSAYVPLAALPGHALTLELNILHDRVHVQVRVQRGQLKAFKTGNGGVRLDVFHLGPVVLIKIANSGHGLVQNGYVHFIVGYNHTFVVLNMHADPTGHGRVNSSADPSTYAIIIAAEVHVSGVRGVVGLRARFARPFAQQFVAQVVRRNDSNCVVHRHRCIELDG